jgi:Flp pilus assembly protein TadD
MRLIPILMLAPSLHAAVGQAPKQNHSTQANEFVRAADDARQHGDLKTAIEDYRKALAIQPDLTKAHAGLGAALAAAGQFDEAVVEDRRALSATPQDETTRMNLAMALYRKGDLAHAATELEAIHVAHPGDLSAAILLAYTYNKLGREAEAANLLGPLEAGHENNLELQYALAFALIQSGKQGEGLPRMEKVARAKKSAEAWFIAGSARFYRGEMRDARADLDAAIELNPALPGLYSLAGQARYAMQDMEGAATAFRAALRANPMDFVANRDLGAMRLKEGDFETARPLLELALQLQPQDPLTRLQVAKLDDMTGRSAEAAAILEDLVKTDPDWLDPHWLLAAVYSQLNRPEDGRREREIAQQIQLRQRQAGANKK